MRHTKFSKKRLSATISMLLGATVAAPTYAQEDQGQGANVEVIEVQGIRGSLARSQDLKRSASGIVDAISAEELGKFPDTNLAESLQRITGVTISRNNNEGSQITVRGFGPDFNLLTLNGRQMPGTGNTRSFALENLASTGVQTLEVYKSSRVDVPTGGLGATVNIITAKPLSSPGLKYSFSAKGLVDTSNEAGDDVTPEIAGLYSQTFADDTFGISLSASYQERDFQRQEAEVPGWQANQGPFNQATSFVDPRPMAATDEADLAVDGVADGRVGNTFVPRQVAYRVNDVQRERSNLHLTMQYAPRDDMTFTLDALHNESSTATEGYGFGVWFNFGGNVTDYELADNGTAIRYTEVGGDFAHNRVSETLEVEQKSVGFNWEWLISDSWTVEVDYHDSSNAIDNGGDPGTRGGTNVILGPNNIASKTYDFTAGGIPQFSIEFPHGGEARPSDFEPLFAQFGRFEGESEVEQFQIHTRWDNLEDSFLTTVKFGATYTEQSLGGRSVQLANQGFQQFQGNTAIFPDNLFTRRDQSGLLDEFTGGLATNYFFDFNLSEVLGRFADFFPGFQADPFNAPGSLQEIDNQGNVLEETMAAYVSADLYFEPWNRPLDVKVGLRYEETDVTSSSVENAPLGLRWFGGAEWRTLFDNTQRTPVSAEGNYDLLLPSIDLKWEVADDMFTRMSWGKSISRVNNLGALLPNRSLTPRPAPGSRTGSFGNPSLEPFESTNFDVSFEWYYSDTSYMSVGYFRKDVKNFISSGITELTFEGLRDPIAGPRALQAIAELEAEGIQTTTDNIFDRIIANGGGTTIDGQPAVDQNSNDPLATFVVGQPTNNPDELTVDGIEIAIQHVFGETGFGVGLNATLVDSASEFDINLLEPQQPLTGVSDSANAQVFYEKDGLSIKVTYAWRDDFLAGAGQSQGSGDSPPTFTRAAGIVDFSINYDIDDNLTVFAEGYNVTNETEENFGRFEQQFLRGAQFDVRYALGARYTF